MQELFDDIKTFYEYFNGGKYIFFTLFLFSIIYIFATEENKKIRNFFVWYSIVIVFLIIWNPLAIKVLNKLINFSSMYRLYYMLPICLSIAYAFTKMLENIENKYKKVFGLVGTACIIIFVRKLYI